MSCEAAKSQPSPQSRSRKDKYSTPRTPSLAPNTNAWWWTPDGWCINQGLQWGHWVPCRLGPGANSVASQRHDRAARFKEEWGLPQYQKIFGHGMVLTLRCCCCCCCCFFFFFKLITTTHIYILLICYGTNPFSFKAIQNTFRLEEITNSCY